MVDIRGLAGRAADYLKKPKRAWSTLTTAWDFSYMSKFEVGMSFTSFGLTANGVGDLISSGFGLLNLPQAIAGAGKILFGQAAAKHYYHQTSRMEEDYRMVEEILKDNENDFYGVFEELEKRIEENDYNCRKVFSWDVDKGNWDNWVVALVNSYCKKQAVKTELEKRKDNAFDKRKDTLESRKAVSLATVGADLETLADA
jgi:hypothetical protein